MTIFVVISQPPQNGSSSLAAAIREHFSNANYELAGGTWLVAGKTTAKGLSDQLGITDGKNGGAVVVEMASYFGRSNPNVWTWIKLHWDAGDGGA